MFTFDSMDAVKFHILKFEVHGIVAKLFFDSGSLKF